MPIRPAARKASTAMDHSRRKFLKHASIGAAAAGAAVAVPAWTTSASAEETELSGPAHAGSFVAWVKNPASGEIAVLVGQQELVFTDKKMARRLAQVAAQALRS